MSGEVSEESPRISSEDTHRESTWIWKFWTTRSRSVLQNVETKILSHVRTPFERFNVNISSSRNNDLNIWTISFNTESKEIPLVMLHGLGGGIALWLLNFDAFAAERPVYAIDVIGFGRSSRPAFPHTPEECEQKFISCINEWRRKMKITDMILMGHSFGGFLATSYAMKYPQFIVHLILADPWGFLERPLTSTTITTLPRWARATITSLPRWNPLWPLRAAGPFGKWIVQKVRSDILEKFDEVSPNLSDLFLTYIHQINVQNPTGESAFQTMMATFFWAKNPMINRIDHIPEKLPMTFILGGRSWIDPATGTKVQEKRKGCFVEVKIIEESGHHVYALSPLSFNSHVNDVCERYTTKLTSASYQQ